MTGSSSSNRFDLKLIQSMERIGDPLADRAVAALMDPAAPTDTHRLGIASQMMAQWARNGELANWQPEEPVPDPGVASELKAYLAKGAALPDWVNPAQVARAEQIFMEHGPLSCTLLFCTSLPECYVLPHLAEVLQIAGQLEAHTEHRVRQTAAMVFPVMMRGGLLGAEGAGVAQVLKVRLIHATIRHLILQGDPAKIKGQVAPTQASSPPVSLYEALYSHGWNVDTQGVPCNQVELAYTLLTFSYSFLQGMRRLGQGLSKQDEEAYLHTWNVMGHVLGIQPELMAHNMEEAEALFTLVRRHAQTQQVTPDPRPALGRALMQTMANSISLPIIRHIPVPLTQWLIGPQTARDIGLAQQVSILTRATFLIGFGLTRVIDSTVGLLVPGFSLSRLFTRILGFHLLTRFLLSQTRPLNLPDHLLAPLDQTLTAWSEDKHAAPWLNRIEDRFTASGVWSRMHASQRPTS